MVSKRLLWRKFMKNGNKSKGCKFILVLIVLMLDLNVKCLYAEGEMPDFTTNVMPDVVEALKRGNYELALSNCESANPKRSLCGLFLTGYGILCKRGL